MRIKTFESSRFAGLRNTRIDFEEGLNVILGPNESGKSTIIDGIHSTLFKDTKLRKNNNADKDFSFKFMPKPSGDFIDGRLVLGHEDGDFEIYKEWGSSEHIQIIDLDGNIIKDRENIEGAISEFLNYGASTYSNIVFAKQRDLKAAIGNIIRDREITSEINDLLRQTMMELDGISMDKIESNIHEEIEKLYKRWDREKNYPENNRGANNPYKVGLGEIVEHFYAKENLKIQMENADRAEKEYELVGKSLKETKDRKEACDRERLELEEIEEDVNDRSLLEAELGLIESAMEDLRGANRNWPMTQEDLKRIDEELESLKARRGILNREREAIELYRKKEGLEKKLGQIEKIDKEIKELEEALGEISPIEKEDIGALRSIKKEISDLEITMKASKMMGTIKLSGDKPLLLSRDLEEEEEVAGDMNFQANALISLSYGDEFQVEIRTGDMDFKQIKESYKTLEDDYAGRLKELRIGSLEEGETNLKSIEEKKREIKSSGRDLEMLLDGRTREDLKEDLSKLKEVESARTYEEIEEELEALHRDEVEMSTEKKTKENQIHLWEEKYRDHDNVVDLLLERRGELKEKESRLENLKPLPDRFKSSQDFKDRLRELKDRTEKLNFEMNNLKDEEYHARSNLLDDSYEELKKEYIEAERDYEKSLKRGEKLLKIQRVFFQTKEELSKDPMKPLVDEFARLLDIITEGSYKQGEIDEDFDIRLRNKNGEIPIELLSAGTYDAVTLALRFALLTHIFKDQPGYVVLDDCLVDLDPRRKAQSIDLINEFAQDYQVIFTTCDPETARELGGNIIELG